eukprot:scaffold496_cov236-Pinguiococcus_pyrenoidosus.AAC.11
MEGASIRLRFLFANHDGQERTVDVPLSMHVYELKAQLLGAWPEGRHQGDSGGGGHPLHLHGEGGVARQQDLGRMRLAGLRPGAHQRVDPAGGREADPNEVRWVPEVGGGGLRGPRLLTWRALVCPFLPPLFVLSPPGRQMGSIGVCESAGRRGGQRRAGDDCLFLHHSVAVSVAPRPHLVDLRSKERRPRRVVAQKCPSLPSLWLGPSFRTRRRGGSFRSGSQHAPGDSSGK